MRDAKDEKKFQEFFQIVFLKQNKYVFYGFTTTTYIIYVYVFKRDF